MIGPNDNELLLVLVDNRYCFSNRQIKYEANIHSNVSIILNGSIVYLLKMVTIIPAKEFNVTNKCDPTTHHDVHIDCSEQRSLLLL